MATNGLFLIAILARLSRQRGGFGRCVKLKIKSAPRKAMRTNEKFLASDPFAIPLLSASRLAAVAARECAFSKTLAFRRSHRASQPIIPASTRSSLANARRGLRAAVGEHVTRDHSGQALAHPYRSCGLASAHRKLYRGVCGGKSPSQQTGIQCRQIERGRRRQAAPSFCASPFLKSFAAEPRYSDPAAPSA